MAGTLEKTTQYANRYGLDVEIYAIDNPSMSGNPLMTIDFANISNIDISGDRVWATGGQDHANKIGFNNPLNGTFTLSTQILTTDLLMLMSGGTVDTSSSATEVVFENTTNSMPKYYIIKAETVWQDADGATYAETMVFHKASPQRALNIEYQGDGDPTSVDIVFDLLQDADHKILTITKAASN